MGIMCWKWVLENISMEFKNGWKGQIKERDQSMIIEVLT